MPKLTCKLFRSCSRCGRIRFIKAITTDTCPACDAEFNRDISIGNLIAWLEVMIKRTNEDGTKFLGPAKLSTDPSKMQSAVDGRWLRALIKRFSASSIYLGATVDGVDPHNKYLVSYLLYCSFSYNGLV